MSKRKLFSVTLQDCKVDTFTVGGHGGSGKDTSNTGVRISHPPSGAVGKSTESRSQLANKRTAFRRMAETPAFRFWAKNYALQLQGAKSIEQTVAELMHPDNLKIESRGPDGWSPFEDSGDPEGES